MTAVSQFGLSWKAKLGWSRLALEWEKAELWV